MAESAPGRPEIVRIVAPNPGPMTLAGTNTYIVGRDPAWVIDPGPADEGHVEAIRSAAERGGIGGVVLTHGHSDHSDAVELLGEPLVWGEPMGADEIAMFTALWTDPWSGRATGSEQPATEVESRKSKVEPGTIGPFTLLPTPGHATDHVALIFGDVCFCGDLILGEGSSIVPPAAGGGSLIDYMQSLDRVAELGAALLAPGHGPWITDPAAKLAEYRDHRLSRERRLVKALEGGERSRERLLDTVWDDVDATLRPAAAIAMQAHLEKLMDEPRWSSLSLLES